MLIPKGIPIREVVPFNIYRKAVAYKTTESWQSVPHAVVQADLDVTEVVGWVERAKKHPAYADAPLTLNTVMLKIIAEGLKASPHMNAHIRYNPRNTVGELIVYDDINMAIPFMTDEARMVTPVLKQVGKKPLPQLCADMVDLRRRVANTNFDLLLVEIGREDTIAQLKQGRFGVLRRVYANLYGPKRLKLPSKAERRAYKQVPEKDRLTPRDVVTATTLVTNIGSVLRRFPARITLIEVIPPQVTAFGLGAARKQSAVVENESGKDEIVPRWVMPLTVAADHRAFDFTEAMGCAERLTQLCGQPGELFPELGEEGKA